MRAFAVAAVSPEPAGPVPSEILIRRLAVFFYGCGIVTSQVAAHMGALDVDNLRLFELLGVITLCAVSLTWFLSEKYPGSAVLVSTSLSATALIAVAVELSGGSNSPLWVYFLFPVIFNAFSFRNAATWGLLPVIVAASSLAALLDGNRQELLFQLIVLAPIYTAISLSSRLVVQSLRHLARQDVAAADVEARLDEARRWGDRLQTLHSVSHEITSLTSVKAIADAVIRHTQTAIAYDTARFYLFDGDVLVPIAYRGIAEYAFENPDVLRVNKGQGLTGWAALHGVSLNVPDVRSDARAGKLPGCDHPEESMLLSPLLIDREVVGVIVLVRIGKHQYSDDDLTLLDMLSAQTATAVEKAWSLNTANHLARTDELTGLPNFRAMNEQLQMQLHHAETRQAPLALAVLDIDRFKQVNDHHGHLAGNAALRELAILLRAYSRATDIVGRVGGDEFMVIMPDTTHDDGVRIIRHITAQILRRPISLGQGTHQHVNIHLSFGSATFPQDGANPRELHQVADVRMYASKNTNHSPVELPHMNVSGMM